MRLLLTAIGSMSAECAIRKLKESGWYVVGCDIYPKEWHYETSLCDAFYQAPYATNQQEYVNFLLDVCKNEQLSYILPLTDLEIDVINDARTTIENAGITICTQDGCILNIARNKYELYKLFKDDTKVPTIKTCLLTELSEDMVFPCVAKPYNGRSSEGLLKNASREQVSAIENKSLYIIQEQIDGDIFTVDFCRCRKDKKSVAIPRRELLRTKNGAGLTVEVTSNSNLIETVSHIGDTLDINGCVNMEFILNNGSYYLIDINPRFSAGVAFSVLAGYDMINNHMNCFRGKVIEGQITIEDRIMIKRYQEV